MNDRPTNDRPMGARPIDDRSTGDRATADRSTGDRATADFEAEVRTVLHELAGPPAPSRLLARVAAIPQEEPRPGRFHLGLPNILRPLAGLAAVAVAIVIAAGLLGLLRGVSGTGSPTLPPASTPRATAPVAVNGSPAPSTEPSGAPPTVSPPTTAPATPSPTLSGSAGVIPAGFAPVSVTFVSASQGWVLGSAPCGTARCAVIARTTDGGQTWTRRPAPATTVDGIDGMWSDGATGVGGIRFADPDDGWIFGPDLWVTHDGGATWQRLAVPGGSASQVLALEAHAGVVQAVVTDGVAGFKVATSPVARDAWAVAAASLPFGAGPVPSVQLVLSGTAGWVVEVDREVIGGLRLGSAGWQSWQPPCTDVKGAAILAASTARDVVAICDEGVWGPVPSGDTAGQHLFVSIDGGHTFTRRGATLPADVGTLAAADPSTIVAAGGTMIRSTDGGATWQTIPAGSPGKEGTFYLGFTTASQGVLIHGGRVGPGGMLMTYDGGRTWHEVTF